MIKSINFKYAAARPYTPVEGTVYHKDHGIYEPVYSAKNSARYRDFRLMRFRQMFGTYFTSFVLKAINILDINNLFGYTYSRDSSEWQEIKSYFGRRTVVLGVAVNL